jgi:glycosyltransferase involved in cell wall biosynthesis
MLTLITATLNAARFLDRAIASVAGEALPIEHWVIDGGSTDETLDVCRRYPSVNIIVEPGCSIYEAWNIGLDRARGEAVMFLNADDELMPDAARSVGRALDDQPDAEIIAGRAIIMDDDHPERSPLTLVAAPGGKLDPGQLALGAPAINAMAFRRTLFDRRGGFETCYRVAGDRAFLLRLSLLAVPPRVFPVDAVLYRYHVHAGSLTLKRGLEQRLRIARDHLALSRSLLDDELPASAELWLRHMYRREATVATLRCLAAGQPVRAWRFLRGFGS